MWSVHLDIWPYNNDNIGTERKFLFIEPKRLLKNPLYSVPLYRPFDFSTYTDSQSAVITTIIKIDEAET